MKLRNLALFAVVCALALPTFAASPAKPGKWQVTMEMDIPGMPMKMPPISFTHCLTKEQAENPENAVPKSQKDKDCKVSDLKVDGNTVSYKMECPKSQVSGTGTVTYTDDSYKGVMEMKMGEQEMKTKYSGKRLGDCDEK